MQALPFAAPPSEHPGELTHRLSWSLNGNKKLGQYPVILLTSRLVNDAYVLLLVLFTRQRKLEQVDTYYDFHFICL